MDRTQHDNKVKSTLQKLEWLQNTIHECIAMDQSRRHDRPATTAILNDVALLERLEEKLRLGRQITRSDMGLCNVILKRIKSFYRIDIDWRGDIKSHHRTEHVLKQKSDKMNLLYSWIEW